MIELNNISHIYGDGTKAIDNVSLSSGKGEFCVLLGASGSGKSTLMSMLNGLITPTQGEIKLNGEHVNKKNMQRLQKQVSMIHQQLHLVPRLAVLHNVISGKLHDLPTWRCLIKNFKEEDQKRAFKLLADVDLEQKHVFRRASELSGGQQQRVAIARAFMPTPSVVLADEPVASLDPKTSRGVLDILKKTAKHNKTTVICSLHQLDYAFEFADRIIALRDGKKVYDGDPKALTDDMIQSIYKNHPDEIQFDKKEDYGDIQELEVVSA